MNRNFALIGYPLGHSLSPQIHKRLFELSGKDFTYSLTEIKPENLNDSFRTLKMLDGFNVTIPHKINIIPFCTKLHPLARRYGSVNCVKVNGDEIIGYNTDVDGFVKSVEMLGASLSGKVCLLGCGGVGRMMAIETAYQEGNLTIAVRESDLDVANEVKDEILRQLPDAEVCVTTLDKISGSFDLIVNATPVGMFPDTDAMPVDKSVLSLAPYLFDVIYNPVETKLMKEAEAIGVRTMGGMAMLVLQAAVAHEIWDNSSYSDENLRMIVKEMESLIK